MKLKKIFYLSATFVFALSSCNDEETEGSVSPNVFNVKGKAESMIRGSHVEIRTLDESLTPTGNSYTATIDNDFGDFNYEALKINNSYAKLTVGGYFFNEVHGELSEGTIQLDAIVDLNNNNTININVLTHLMSTRIRHLVTTKDQTYKQANAQAQEELLTQFGLQKYASKDISQFSITSGDDASGALIAITALILTDRSDAEIVEFLSILTNEFGAEGAFSQETKKKIQSGIGYLNERLDRISENLKNRYKELGKEIAIKDLAYYFDWDNDGIAGNELDESDTVTLSENELNVPTEGGEYAIIIKSDKSYFLNPPAFESGDILPEGQQTITTYFNKLYEDGDINIPASFIEIDKAINKDVISIKIAPAQFREDLSTTVTVYNIRGKVVAEIAVKQQGDKDYWIKHDPVKLSSDGRDIVEGCMASMRNAISEQLNLQTAYAYQEDFSNPVPYQASDDRIRNTWSYYYRAINLWILLKEADADKSNCYQSFIDTHLALAYYQLSSRWGGVPFIMSYSYDYDLPRTEEAEILSKLEKMLVDAMTDLNEHRYDAFHDANSMLFVSKDVARTLLAYIFCNQKKFDKALPLLEEVINGGNYHLEHSQAAEYKNNS